jgi:hypothetical protein
MYTKAPPREDVGHRQQETETEKEASPVIEEHNGYPATYTCDAPEGGYTKTLQFQFDYEFVIKDPMESLVEIWYQDLPALEWGILARVVQVIGLESCSFDEQQGIREWRPVGADGSANMIGNSMFEESRIISLSRSRADELDMTVGTLRFVSLRCSIRLRFTVHTSTDQVTVALFACDSSLTLHSLTLSRACTMLCRHRIL